MACRLLIKAGEPDFEDDTMSDENAEAAPPQPAKKSPWMLIVIAVVVLAAGGGGAFYFLGGKDEATSKESAARKSTTKPPAQYVKLDPPFVVNFEAKGLMRFLQVTVEIMTRDPATIDLINKNDPMIRNDLIMLFANQHYEDLSTREGKEKLREEALKVVAGVINAEGGNGSKVEQLYFTSFVMQ